MRPRHLAPALALLAVATFAPCLFGAQQQPPPPKVEIPGEAPASRADYQAILLGYLPGDAGAVRASDG
jgi:hypothetical protein